jgi:hypothetical protein
MGNDYLSSLSIGASDACDDLLGVASWSNTTRREFGIRLYSSSGRRFGDNDDRSVTTITVLYAVLYAAAYAAT